MIHLPVEKFFILFFRLLESSGAGEPPPNVLPDPYVNLSIHTAPLTQAIDDIHLPTFLGSSTYLYIISTSYSFFGVASQSRMLRP